MNREARNELWSDKLPAVQAYQRLQAGPAAELDALLPALLARAIKGEL